MSFFSAGAQKGPEKFAKEMGDAMLSIQHHNAALKLTTSKSRGGPLSLSLRGFFFHGAKQALIHDDIIQIHA